MRVQELASRDDALLCERCGYHLAGLGVSSACPECGQSVGESLPSRRAGSPWQNGAGPVAWWRTSFGTLRHPTTMFRGMRVDRRGAWSLLGVNIAIAAAFIAAPWIGVFIWDPARVSRAGDWSQRALGMLLGSLILWAPVAAAILILTWVEYRGVRFFAARRGWRLSSRAAWQVCAHASIGWIFCGVLPMLLMAVLFSAQRFGLVDVLQDRLPWLHKSALGVTWGTVAGAGSIAVCGLAGLFIFELLVYLGVRQCRFANAPGSEAQLGGG